MADMGTAYRLIGCWLFGLMALVAIWSAFSAVVGDACMIGIHTPIEIAGCVVAGWIGLRMARSK